MPAHAKDNEAAHPLRVGLPSSDRVVPNANRVSQLVEKSGLGFALWSRRNIDLRQRRLSALKAKRWRMCHAKKFNRPMSTGKSSYGTIRVAPPTSGLEIEPNSFLPKDEQSFEIASAHLTLDRIQTRLLTSLAYGS